MSHSSRKAIVGDIGATHMRFAVADIDELSIDHFVQFKCGSFASAQEGLAAYLGSIPHPPAAASIVVAGTVSGGVARLAHRDWSISEDAIRMTTRAGEVCLSEGRLALARALPHLGAHDHVQIGGKAEVDSAPKVVVASGTGLQVAGLIEAFGRRIAISGEAGQASFPFLNDNEFELYRRLSPGMGHLPAEAVLCGSGLTRLYQILLEKVGRPARELTPAEILRQADDNDDPVALGALGQYATWLGRFAGDVALAQGARGGVYMAGGLPPRLLGILEDGRMRTAFEAKGTFSAEMAAIPVFVIKAVDVGLKGAALLLSDQRLDKAASG